MGISITAVTSDIIDSESDFGTRYVDQRLKIKRIVETIKQYSKARIVLGGSGFNYYVLRPRFSDFRRLNIADSVKCCRQHRMQPAASWSLFILD